ncbi:uncharacterized protein LOC111497455 isoform X4 [Cucurbita maxima]|uniref:phosphoglycerate mutase (2,3-diphosphoglycerate-dependent) n=1 Tax=Cucurbita maxima TaxID=3661 RepID=A0A6J1KTF2_CUCMA|nr:uncharacterized protein LOC111497455 isoform X4 [Cucurbita maxima]
MFMISSGFLEFNGAVPVYNHACDSNPHNVSLISLPVIRKGFDSDVRLFRRGICSMRDFRLSVVCATPQVSIMDHITPVSDLNSDDSMRPSIETALILIRHGESMWNEKNLFTGSVDVPLTRRGVEEAIEAGKRISNLPIDYVYTSALIRSQMTAVLALIQHRCKKVPIIIHNCNKQAEAWSQIYSDEARKQSFPVIRAWQLNERMYGELQGLNKQEIAKRYGEEQVHEWRRSYEIPPPEGESLQMCSQRAVGYFKEHIEPHLQSGKHVMVAAHANTLRSIIMYLEKLTSRQVIGLEVSTGVPLLYIYKEGTFMKRGSPVGSSEAGVYALTRARIFYLSIILCLDLLNLALYRQKLDEMSC